MSEFNEPWKTVACYDSSGYPFILIDGIKQGEPIDAAEKRAKRAELCVNALAGLPSEQVEALAEWDLGKVLDHLNFVRSLRAYPMDRPTSDPMLLFNGVKNGVENCRKEQEA